MYGSNLRMEFLLSKTIPKFDTPAKKLALTWGESYKEFAHCLDRPALMAWQETLHGLPELDYKIAANFTVATDESIKKLLNNKTPCNQQWIYLLPGSNQFKNKWMKTPNNHLCRLCNLVCTSELVPPDNMPI
jgi:hypothetical protein